MDEFEFLSRMFRRLGEAEGFAADAKIKRQKERHDAWDVAALSIRSSIKDYLSMRAYSVGGGASAKD